MMETKTFLRLRTHTRIVTIVLSISVVVLGGCSKKTDVNAELENAVKVLDGSNPGQVSTPQAPAAQPQNAPVAQMAPAQQVSQALTSLKEGKYTETITYMESARSNPRKSPEQMMAIQNAMAAVMNDLYARAANGDAAARQAINKYNEERNRR